MADRSNRGGEGSDKIVKTELFWKLLHKQIAPKNSVDRKRINYTLAEIDSVLQAVVEVLGKDETLLTMSPPIVIVGDIHGQYYDLIRMFNTFGETNKDGSASVSGVTNGRYLFLGDYVDRGTNSLECIMMVFTLKILFPRHYGLLRGNHECRAINKVYGFYDELVDRYGQDDADALWHSFNNAFAMLPLAAMIGKKILCMHGGISPELHSLEDIRAIKRPLEDPASYPTTLAVDLLWADPMIGLSGWVPNHVRGVSCYFGEDRVEAICKQLGLELIVRAHQMMQNGYHFFCNRKLITIFTAPRYFVEKNNKGATLKVDKSGKLSIKILLPTTEDKRGENVFRRELDQTYSDDSGYQVFVPPLPPANPRPSKAASKRQSQGHHG
ncbi:unnamed protein product, partial [Mesorhabditis spiculigera]